MPSCATHQRIATILWFAGFIGTSVVSFMGAPLNIAHAIACGFLLVIAWNLIGSKPQ